MNKSVQILILLAVIPAALIAREETLEERKKRIMRKYLQEEATVSDNQFQVVDDEADRARIKDSEKYGLTKDKFDKHDMNQVSRPMPRRNFAAPQREQSSSWLLENADSSDIKDPFADPFDDPFSLKSEKKSDSRSDAWSRWQETSDSRKAQGRVDPYASRGRSLGTSTGQPASTDTGRSLYGSSRSSSYGTPTPRSGYSYGDSGTSVQGGRVFGATPETGPLGGASYSSGTTSRERQRYSGQSSLESSRTLSPTFKSSEYDNSYLQGGRGGSWKSSGSAAPGQAQPAYRQQDAYQKYKQTGKGWNPSTYESIDDAMKRKRP